MAVEPVANEARDSQILVVRRVYDKIADIQDLRMKKMVSDSPAKTLLTHRRLLWASVVAEARAQFAGSLGGVLWLAIGPFLLLVVYTLVYAVIFRVRMPDMSVSEYIFYVFSGLMPFISFATALTAGAASLFSHKHVLLNTVFPSALIPVRSVIISMLPLPAGMAIVLIGDAVFNTLSLYFALVPAVIFLQFLFLCGLSWILSLLSIIVRDIQQFLIYSTMLLLVLTPIAYTPDMVPGALKLITYINPLAYYVLMYQSLLVLDTFPPMLVAISGTILSITTFWLGYEFHIRTREAFFDYA